MGPIQTSFNQLTLSALGAVGGLAHGFKGAFDKPAKTKPQANPKTEVSSGMGNIAKVGKNYSNKNIRSYQAAAKAVDNANDAILQKALTQEAVKIRFSEIMKGGK